MHWFEKTLITFAIHIRITWNKAWQVKHDNWELSWNFHSKSPPTQNIVYTLHIISLGFKHYRLEILKFIFGKIIRFSQFLGRPHLKIIIYGSDLCIGYTFLSEDTKLLEEIYGTHSWSTMSIFCSFFIYQKERHLNGVQFYVRLHSAYNFP